MDWKILGADVIPPSVQAQNEFLILLSEMAKRGSRRANGANGLIGRVYSPLNHVVSAARNIGKNAFTRSGKIVNTGLGFVQNTGRSLAGHANGAVSNLLGNRKTRNTRNTRKSRTSRKDRKTRKDRK